MNKLKFIIGSVSLFGMLAIAMFYIVAPVTDEPEEPLVLGYEKFNLEFGYVERFVDIDAGVVIYRSTSGGVAVIQLSKTDLFREVRE